MKKKILNIMVVFMMAVFVMELCSVCAAAKKASVKKIALCEEKTYQIKHQKKNRYKNTNPRVVYVSKKGKIIAKKSGKSIIKVYKKKKLIKKITVNVYEKTSRDNQEEDYENNTVEEVKPTDIPAATNAPVLNGGLCQSLGYVIDKIEVTDEENSTVYLSKENGPNVVIERYLNSTIVEDGFQAGCKVNIVYNVYWIRRENVEGVEYMYGDRYSIHVSKARENQYSGSQQK